MKIIDAFLDALFPEDFTCELCGKEIFDKGRLCNKCKGTVSFIKDTCCVLCGRKTNVNGLCLDCKAQTPVFDKGASAIEYSGGGQTLIYAFKNGKPYLKEYFADLLVEKCAAFEGAEGITCVPMTKSAESERGYNQAQLLAKALSKRLKIPYIKGAVKKVKSTHQQKSLNKREREENLKSCFKADKNLVKGKTLIVADDVMTTGATADAVCAALKKQGAKEVYFVSVASVTYKGDM